VTLHVLAYSDQLEGARMMVCFCQYSQASGVYVRHALADVLKSCESIGPILAASMEPILAASNVRPSKAPSAVVIP
jgi:hypothetical protein